MYVSVQGRYFHLETDSGFENSDFCRTLKQALLKWKSLNSFAASKQIAINDCIELLPDVAKWWLTPYISTITRYDMMHIIEKQSKRVFPVGDQIVKIFNFNKQSLQRFTILHPLPISNPISIFQTHYNYTFLISLLLLQKP